tara:strand:- start:286 stop:417 length:132 start_codon:yes stop_codon:yes gene_type:complete
VPQVEVAEVDLPNLGEMQHLVLMVPLKVVMVVMVLLLQSLEVH